MQMPQETNAYLSVEKEEIYLNGGGGIHVPCQLTSRNKIFMTFDIFKVLLIFVAILINNQDIKYAPAKTN